MTAKEIAERAYERMHGSDLAPNHVIKQLESEIKLFALHIAEQAVDAYKERLNTVQNLYEVGTPQHNAFGIAINEIDLTRIKKLTNEE